MKNWFEDGNYGQLNRRDDQNRLKRIAKQSEEQDAGRIERWLDLAKKMFDNDDDPTPSAA